MLPARGTDYHQYNLRSDSEQSDGSERGGDGDEPLRRISRIFSAERLSVQLPTVGEEDETTAANKEGEDEKTSLVHGSTLGITLHVVLPSTPDTSLTSSAKMSALETTASTPATPTTAVASSPVPLASGASLPLGSRLPQPATLPSYRKPSFDSPSQIVSALGRVPPLVGSPGPSASSPGLSPTMPLADSLGGAAGSPSLVSLIHSPRASAPSPGSPPTVATALSSPSPRGLLSESSLLPVFERLEPPLEAARAPADSVARVSPRRESAEWEPADKRPHGLFA